MKINTKRVVLRPFRPGYLSIIPRLPSIVSKNQILFKIISPVTFIIKSIKNIFKKAPFSQNKTRLTRPRKLQIRSNVCYPVVINEKMGDNQEDYVNDCGDFSKSKRKKSQVLHRRTAYTARSSRSSHTTINEHCLSCKEDCAPNRTCPLCLGLNSTLPPSSCEKCQKKGPLVNFCLCFHDKRPHIFLPDDNTNFQVGQLLDQRGIMLKNRKCNRKSPSIFNCPMCLSMQPIMGECGCRKCKKCRPLVQLRSSKYCKTPMVYICPCLECVRLRPKIKICDPCRMKQNQLVKNKSYYAIIL